MEVHTFHRVQKGPLLLVRNDVLLNIQPDFNQTSIELSNSLCTMYTRPIEQNTGLSENPTVTEWKQKQAEHV